MKNLKTKNWLVAEALLVLLLAAGVSYAWFIMSNRMTTMVSVVPPDRIAIAGPHGSEMLLLNLDYNENAGDQKDGDQIMIYRPICIKSTSQAHQLEIAHTTNIKGLSFSIYPAKEDSKGRISGVDPSSNTEYRYSFDEKVELTGVYQNQTSSDKDEYRAADGTWHDKNYSTGDTVQTHAEPLYWLAQKSYDKKLTVPADAMGVTSEYHEAQEYNPITDEYVNYYYTYYIIEITWTDKTKETDLFYLLAQNIDTESTQSN